MSYILVPSKIGAKYGTGIYCTGSPLQVDSGGCYGIIHVTKLTVRSSERARRTRLAALSV